MNTEALKEQARRHEQREEWSKAIELYGKAVDQLAHDDQPDLALYNRLGDLEIRVGNVERGVEFYEQAIDLYVEAELPNNAIAICRKVVRNLPTRHPIFLKMGQIRARQGFLTDARNNFLEYAERMQKAQDLEEAFRALIEFVDLAPDDIEARTVLAAQLEAHERTDEALEQYIAIHQRFASKGRLEEAETLAEKIRTLDPAAVIPAPQSGVPSSDPAAATDDFIGFETTSLVEDFPTLEAAPSEDVAEDTAGLGVFEIEPPREEETEEDAGLVMPDVAFGEIVPAAHDEVGEEPGAGDEQEGAEADVAESGLGEAQFGEFSFDEAGSDASAEADLPLEEPSQSTGYVFDAAAPAADPGPGPDHADAVDAADSASWGMDLGTSELESPTAPNSFDSGSDLDDSDRPAGTDDEWDLASPDDPLPLISFEDEETLDSDPKAPPALAAADFGVRDDGDRAQEYLSPVEEIPELDVGLSEFEALSETDGEPAGSTDGEEVDRESLISALQVQLESDPNNGDTWLALAEEFFAQDRAEESSLAIDEALSRFDGAGDLDGSIRAVQTLSAQSPDNVQHRQRMVELAIRKDDRDVLTPAYLALADCLVRGGDGDLARAVYHQVLVADPANQDAVAGLGHLDDAPTTAATEVASSEDYVDLGSLILEDDEEKTTRWKVIAEEPSGDEAADFAKMLAQFKDKVAENLEADDIAAHYDLGTAYKEMGLVDEAINEFQQALRAEADHLPTHELLGQCFMEKGQFEVAVRSMNRALDSTTEVEDELLGIYYQMARAHEQLGNKGDALEFYEKVFALDINFQDVTERLRELR